MDEEVKVPQIDLKDFCRQHRLYAVVDDIGMVEFYVGKPYLEHFSDGCSMWLCDIGDRVAFGATNVFSVPKVPFEQSLITPEGEMPYAV